MSKFLKMTSLSLLPLMLSSCVASGFLSHKIRDSEDARWVKTDQTDNIIAVGKPTTPIKSYENALVLVGQKYNYLIQQPSSDGLRSIFEKVDLRYLSIDLPKEEHIAIKQSGEHYSCPSEFGCSWDVNLHFKKPFTQVSESEKETLEELGFFCYKAETNLSCRYNTYKIAFTVVKNTQQPHLAHQLKQPLPIVFYEFQANKGTVGRAFGYALIPIAIAFDIVTFPIQSHVVKINK